MSARRIACRRRGTLATGSAGEGVDTTSDCARWDVADGARRRPAGWPDGVRGRGSGPRRGLGGASGGPRAGLGPEPSRPRVSEGAGRVGGDVALRRACSRPTRGAARRAEPGAGRGGPAHRRPGPGHRRRRLGQDPGAHPPHRPPHRPRGRLAVRDPGHHLHQQGRRRDEGARRRAGGAGGPQDVGVHVPLGVRAHPAARGVAPRLPVELHHLRPGRRAAAHQLRAARPRHRPQALPAALGARRYQRGQERGHRRRCLRRVGIADLRAPHRRRLPRVPGPAAARRGHGLRRPAAEHGLAVPPPPRRAGPVPAPLHPDPGRRVPGHQPRAERPGPAPRRRPPQRLRRGRLGPVPPAGHARADARGSGAHRAGGGGQHGRGRRWRRPDPPRRGHLCQGGALRRPRRRGAGGRPGAARHAPPPGAGQLHAAGR